MKNPYHQIQLLSSEGGSDVEVKERWPLPGELEHYQNA
jgi:hypothetical protein